MLRKVWNHSAPGWHTRSCETIMHRALRSGDAPFLKCTMREVGMPPPVWDVPWFDWQHCFSLDGNRCSTKSILNSIRHSNKERQGRTVTWEGTPAPTVGCNPNPNHPAMLFAPLVATHEAQTQGTNLLTFWEKLEIQMFGLTIFQCWQLNDHLLTSYSPNKTDLWVRPIPRRVSQVD